MTAHQKPRPFLSGSLRGTGLIAVMSFSFLMVSCASIPTDVELQIDVKPEGATVSTQDGWSCVAPCTKTVNRDSTTELNIQAPGHLTVTKSVTPQPIERSRTGLYVGLGAGALIGYSTTDVAHEIADTIVRTFFLGVFKIDTPKTEASDGDKLVGTAAGSLFLGGIGMAIDRAIMHRKAEEPEIVQVELNKATTQ